MRLPAGTVTFMMTDVEASTACWAEREAEMERSFSRLSAEIHELVRRHGGAVIQARGEGDSHFAVFDRASDAARAAMGVQRGRCAAGWPMVRIALHTAEAEPRGGDYLGAAVNRTARLRSTAHGGQTVCSRVVAELVDGTDEVHVHSLGLHRVRDFPTRVELFQVDGDGARTDFPPLRTADLEATPVMTFVATDQANSSQRVAADPGGLAGWQRDLYRALRTASDARDGRFFKYVGDGCLVAFEDPVAAVAFAEEVCSRDLGLRAGVSAGVTQIVEGEPSSLAIWEAAKQASKGDAGRVWMSPVVEALVGAQPAWAP